MSSDSPEDGTGAGGAPTSGLAMWRAAAGAPAAPDPPADRGPALWLAAAGVDPAGAAPPEPRRAARPTPPDRERSKTGTAERRAYRRPEGAPAPVAPQDLPSVATDAHYPVGQAHADPPQGPATQLLNDAPTAPLPDEPPAVAPPVKAAASVAVAPVAPAPVAPVPTGSGPGDVVRDLLAGAFDRVEENSHLGDDWDVLFGDESRSSSDGAPRPSSPTSPSSSGSEASDLDPLERAILQLAKESDPDASAPEAGVTAPPADMPSDAGTWARDAERLARHRAAGGNANSAFPRFGEDLEPSDSVIDPGSDDARQGAAFARVALVAARRPPTDVRERWSGQDRPDVPSAEAASEAAASTEPAEPAPAEPSFRRSLDGEGPAAPMAAGVVRRRRRAEQRLDTFQDEPSIELIERDEAPSTDTDVTGPPAAEDGRTAPMRGAGVLKRRTSPPTARRTPASGTRGGPPATSPPSRPGDRVDEPKRVDAMAGAGVVRRRRTTTGAHAVTNGSESGHKVD